MLRRMSSAGQSCEPEMHSLEKPHAVLSLVAKGGASVHSDVPIRSEETALALVREASRRFPDAWMPLEVCISMRDQLATEFGKDDPLATLFQRIPSRRWKFRHPELERLMASETLGGWALCAETVEYLIEKIEEDRPSAILEFGSGTSSLALAWIMTRLHGDSSMPRVYSIDQSADHIEQTRAVLERHHLVGTVRFHHAELVLQTIGSRVARCYNLTGEVLEQFFGGVRPDLILIDGPAGESGIRFGTVPLVSEFVDPNAVVIVDDGLRDSELDTADQWNRLGYVRWEGIRWEGKGLLSGRVRPALPASTRLWLERVERTIRPRSSYAPPMVSENVAQNDQRVTASRVALKTHLLASHTVARASSSSLSTQDQPRCLFVNTYYPGFLEQHYQRRPELLSAGYDSQHSALQDACFGDSDFYSSGLRAAGWAVQDVIANCPSLQRQWAFERDCDPASAPLRTALDQIAQVRPQVLYVQDLNIATREFLAAARPYVDLIVGQIASPIPPHAHLDGFDLLISSFPHFVEMFRRQGRVAYYQPLAFDPRVLERLGDHRRDYALTFVGGVSPAHKGRYELLTALAKASPIHFWGYGTQALVQQGVEASRLHGDVWGVDMFTVLAKSTITVNHHIDVAQSNANNMRLFEATGCGTLLVTDYKDNLNDLFEIGAEVVAYRSITECADLIEYYLNHKNETAEIAKRGQARTLRDHTYEARMRHTAELLSRHLDIKIGANRLPDPDLGRISYGRQEIEPGQITVELAQSWQSDRIPLKQRSLVQRELLDMYQGNTPDVFKTLAKSLCSYVRPNIELLEIGCASGYYYEVLEYLLNTRLTYLGIDFSDTMIRLARAYYPGVRFEIGDGSALRFQERSIPIVISSCVLLHVREYALHIAEAARVASEIVVFHRTPIARRADTKHFTKFAYGVETFEIRFNEAEFLGLCRSVGMEFIAMHSISSEPRQDELEGTYVFRAPQ
jgi:SAM-dependent methyltransferase/predicted O-methyltransferase YrrM